MIRFPKEMKGYEFIRKIIENERDFTNLTLRDSDLTLYKEDYKALIKYINDPIIHDSFSKYPLDISCAKLNRLHAPGLNLPYLFGLNVNLDYAILTDSNFENAKLYDSSFYMAKLCRVNFNFSNLEESKFKCADLRFTNFREAKLINTDFFRSNLSDSSLEKSNLTKAKLQKADLTNANFTGADLKEADFYETDVTGATFIDIKNFRKVKYLDRMIIDSNPAEKIKADFWARRVLKKALAEKYFE